MPNLAVRNSVTPLARTFAPDASTSTTSPTSPTSPTSTPAPRAPWAPRDEMGSVPGRFAPASTSTSTLLPPATLAQLMGALALYGNLAPADLSRLQSGAQAVMGPMQQIAQVLAQGGMAGGVDVAALAGSVQPADAALAQQLGLLLGMLPPGGKVQQQLIGAMEAGLDVTKTRPGGASFEDRVFALMQGIIAAKQEDIEKRLSDLKKETEDAEQKKSGGGLFGKIFNFASKAVGFIPGVGTAIGAGMNAVGSAFGIGQPKADTKAESRNLKYEEIKNEMQKLSQMQQALSNILNALNETASSAIRAIGK
jgi:hypothetical protein